MQLLLGTAWLLVFFLLFPFLLSLSLGDPAAGLREKRAGAGSAVSWPTLSFRHDHRSLFFSLFFFFFFVVPSTNSRRACLVSEHPPFLLFSQALFLILPPFFFFAFAYGQGHRPTRSDDRNLHASSLFVPLLLFFYPIHGADRKASAAIPSPSSEPAHFSPFFFSWLMPRSEKEGVPAHFLLSQSSSPLLLPPLI